MSDSDYSLRRPQLAISVCDSIKGNGLNDARSGLFLAAPRRVGKTTFLKEDVIPEAIKRGWVTIYVDLMKNINTDPELLLGNAIKEKIAEHEGVISRFARAAKLDKVSVMGTLTLDFTKSGLPPNVTLSDALEILVKMVKVPVVLIVDEAQHALSSNGGISAMFGLKSARDTLNRSDSNPSLMLIMTGSNRDKLAHLVLNKQQPFFGSSISPFPLLGRDFTDGLTQWANTGLTDKNQFDSDAVFEAFKLVGYRPQLLKRIMGDTALSNEASNISALLQKGAQEWQESVWGEYEADFESLTPLQKAVLEVMIKKYKSGFSPFSEESLSSYRELLGEESVSTASIQTALEALRERKLVWKEGRGAYSLEDDGIIEWYMTTRIVPVSDHQQPLEQAPRPK